MAGYIGGRTSAFDYIGPDLPSNPQNGEMWFDTDGASDGSGEVKVYDGASSAWEPTGFTSHADLTDVTRSAHHPPVDVSGPLTQPSDQSLGLSIGDGLADSAGTLVAALGDGLGIDGNGKVYIPAGALLHGEEVDTPSDAHHTKTSSASELSDVSADSVSDAHHTPPTETGTNSAAHSVFVPYGYTPQGSNLYGFVTEVVVKKSNSLGDQDITHTIKAADGTEWSNTHTIGENESAQEYTVDTGGKYIVEITSSGTDAYSSCSFKFRPVSVGSHSHNI